MKNIKFWDFWNAIWNELVVRGTRPEEGDSKLCELLTPIYQTPGCHITDHGLNTEVKFTHNIIS